jgi:phosphatidylglycerol:prolipoprotein diacylglycerol transferase
MHPILFSIGDFFVAWYGLFVALGLLTGTGLSLWLAKRDGLDPNVIFDLLFVVTISLLVGARLFYIVTVWPEFISDPMPHLLSRTGFVFLGGLIGAVGGAVAYLWLRGIPIWRVGDICAPAIPLGHALGRVGCHFTGCCHGARVKQGWESFGLEVPPGIFKLHDGSAQVVGGFAYFDHLDRGWIAETAQTSLPVWPVQLFSSGANLLLAGVLLWLTFRRKFTGQIFLLYFMGYSAIRFFLEMMRGDGERGVYQLGAGIEVSFSQLIGIGLFTVATALYFVARKNKLPGQQKDYPKKVKFPPAETEAAKAK